MSRSVTDGDPTPRIRRFLLALVTVGTAVFVLDLVLLEHFESALQWSPFVVLGLGLLAELAVVARPGAASVRALRVAMFLFVLSGIVGVYLHYRGNYLFELEMEPDSGGLELLWRAATGGVPTLAPAGLAGLGLAGWIYTIRHPSLRGGGDG